jgi:hypothetical protein
LICRGSGWKDDNSVVIDHSLIVDEKSVLRVLLVGEYEALLVGQDPVAPFANGIVVYPNYNYLVQGIPPP